MNNLLFKIVITGGPCAGKTQAISEIKKRMKKTGYTVIVISEVPTEMILSGINPKRVGKYVFQKTIILLQQQKEKIMLNALHSSCLGKIVILYDRGIIDHFTYLSEKECRLIKQELNIDLLECYDNYDLVFHMSSTASELPSCFFNTEHRKDTIKEAAQSDKLIGEYWKNHPNYHYIKCSKDFNEKINNLYDKLQYQIYLLSERNKQ